MIHKSVNDLAPNYMKDMFTYVRDSHSHTTRSSVKNGFSILVDEYNLCFIGSPLLQCFYLQLQLYRTLLCSYSL